jgi:hypothetical protein
MRTRDGIELIGNNPAEIVADLHRHAFEKSANDRAFMAEMQRRVLLQTGKRIRCSSFDVFVSDLIDIGLLLDVDDAAKPKGVAQYAKDDDDIG